MKTITKERAMQIAALWHSGQYSDFYQFTSTGTFVPERILWYCRECWVNIEPEYYSTRETFISERNKRELHSLRNYFVKQAKIVGIDLKTREVPPYGYKRDFLASDTDIKVIGLRELV